MTMFTTESIAAIKFSIEVATLSTLFMAPGALAIAWAIHRYKNVFTASIETLLMLPLILPPVSVGYLLLLFFSPHNYFGKFLSSLGIDVPFSILGAILAAMVVSLPLFVKSIQVALESRSHSAEEAAIALGVKNPNLFIFIILPEIRSGLIAGALLAFVRAIGEFGATIVIAGNIPFKTQGISGAIWTSLQRPYGESEASKLLLLSIGVAIMATLLSRALSRSSVRK